MDLRKAYTLDKLLQSLAPPLSGVACDIDDIIELALRCDSDGRNEYPTDTNRPVHLVLKDIQTHVIDFLTRLPHLDKKHTKHDTLDYFTSVYSVLLGFPVQMVVMYPQIMVTDIMDKGRGVIAIDEIQCNRIVTFYPNDIVTVCMYNRKACEAGLWAAYAKSECHKQLIRVGGIENAFGDYKFTIGNADIYADPTEYKDGCCGHMINDGDGPVKGINNCIIKPLFGGLCLAVVTVAGIHKGEELLLPYGPTYWEDKKLLNRAV